MEAGVYALLSRATETFNVVEGVFWNAIGIVVLIVAWRRRTRLRGLSLAAAVLFMSFGCTDFFEAKTGSWWEPWWLLAWKAFCVLGLLLCFCWYVQLRRRS